MPITIARCRYCNDAFHDTGEGWDVCHPCRVTPSEEDEEGSFTCMNCGGSFDCDDTEKVVQFCSLDCSMAALDAILSYGRIR